MQHNAAFHQGLHFLLRLKQPSGTEIHHYLETFTYDPLKYKKGKPILIHQYVWENPSSGIQRVKQQVRFDTDDFNPISLVKCNSYSSNCSRWQILEASFFLFLW